MSSRIHKTVRLGRSRHWQLYIIGIGVWLSGGLWLLFHYFFVRQGDFGPVENPLTPWWLRLHGASLSARFGSSVCSGPLTLRLPGHASGDAGRAACSPESSLS